MEIALSKEIAGFTMKPSMMFAYPTCLADLYTPKIEHIYLPEASVPPKNVEIKVITGNTGGRQEGSLKWNFYNKVSRPFQKIPTIDCSNQFIFDARFDTDGNVAHVLENVSTPVLFAQRALSEHLGRDIQIKVILRKRSTKISHKIYEMLNIPIVCTNDSVYGNIVEVSPYEELFSIQPEIFNVPIKDYNSNTPERIFIARRGNRRLENNDEVAKFLEAQGFTTYYFEDLTISEEWSIARNAKVVVAVHGAASVHLLFNRLGLKSPDVTGSGIRIVELFSPCFTLPGYRRLETLLNGKWCGVRGQITPKVLQYLDFDNKPRGPLHSPVKDPYKIDLKTLELALAYVGINDDTPSGYLANQPSVLPRLITSATNS